MVLLYLISIAVSNLVIAKLGVSGIYFGAFLIGFDITSRDSLHQRWRNNGLLWRMVLLIISGGIISALINSDSLKVSVASTVSFCCAATVDTLVFHILFKCDDKIKINASNIASSLVDSMIFPLMCFGSFELNVFLIQFLSKSLSGFIWSCFLKNETKINL